MNKLFSKVATLSVGLALAIGVGVAVGSKDAKEARADDTVDFTLSSADPVSKDGVDVSFNKDSGSSAPAWYDAGLRLYASNTVVISSSSSIVGVSFNWEKQGSKAFASVTASNGTYSHPSNNGTGTWTGNASSITFTLGSSGQLQLNTFSVTVSSGSTDTLESITVTGSMSKTSYTTAESWSAAGLVATGHYESGSDKDVTNNVTWSFSPATPALSVTSVVATASIGSVSSSSAAQAVTVEAAPATPGTADNPYTVAQARTAIDSGSGTANVYATGIVSKIVTAYSSQHSNVTFNFSVDGTESAAQLQAYREKSDYSSTVKVGDTVVVYGSLTKYNSTYEFAANCAITSLIPAPDPEAVESIEDIYSAAVGSPVEIDGYYVGAVSDGIYLMDGEYGIFVYKGTAPVGATVNETKLHVSGTSTTFQNLYQVAQGSTISVNASAEIATPINYTLTGSESTADLSVASRRMVEKGVISKITIGSTDYTSSYEGDVPTVDTSKDIFLTVNGVQVIYKKADVTQTVFNVLFGYLLNGKKVNVESFTSFYQTTFQLRFSSVVEATEGYTAEDFAQDLLDQTDAVCEDYDGVTNNKAALAQVWLTLQEKVLSDEEVERFNDEGNDFSAARARYDYLVGKYGLTDFLGRTPAPISNESINLGYEAINNNTTIFIVSIAAVSALAFTVLLVFKKKKQK